MPIGNGYVVSESDTRRCRTLGSESGDELITVRQLSSRALRLTGRGVSRTPCLNSILGGENYFAAASPRRRIAAGATRVRRMVCRGLGEVFGRQRREGEVHKGISLHRQACGSAAHETADALCV